MPPTGDPSSAAVAAAAAAAAASVDCKDQSNGYSSLSKELNAWGSTTPTSAGVGSAHGSSAANAANGAVRPSVCTPDMTRYTPSTADQVARDRAWMNTCSSLASQAAQVSNVLIYRKQLHYHPPQATDATIQTWPQLSHYHLIAASIAAP